MISMTAPRYFDIRCVRGEVTHIDIDNGVVESAGTSFFDSAVIRALGAKGWGVATLDSYDPSSSPEQDAALASALKVSAVTGERVDLAPATHTILPVPPLREDPADVDLDEKTRLLSEIEQSARIPSVVSTRARYSESMIDVIFMDSSGNEASYGITRSGFSVLAVASRNGVMQMGQEREHSITGFSLRHQQEMGRKAAETAVALLDAGSIKGGEMRAVLDPELAGVFAHEAVGHASEGDLVKDGASVLKGKIGEVIGSELVTIVDDPGLPEYGFEPVDAEGVSVKRTEIIKNGVLRSYLHSRETLAAVGDGDAGHARAEGGATPLVRMSNTFIESGDTDMDEIMECCRNGILLKGSRGGQVDTGRGIFQFNAEYGYLIRDGESAGMVKDVSLSGEILRTLHSIVMVGRDKKMHPGFCGKGGQSVPVSDGAPHILLYDAMVGGHA